MKGSKELEKRLAKKPGNDDDTIGYGKPPKASRFMPGQSGNPKGRPKGTKSAKSVPDFDRLSTIILNEAYRKVKVNDGAKQVSVTMAEATFRSIAVNAAKGNTRSQKLFMEIASKTELAKKQADVQFLETSTKYMADWKFCLFEREFNNQTHLPDPVPHPDDIFFDYKNNRVYIHGPMDERQQAEFDRFLLHKIYSEREIERLEAEMVDPDSEPYREDIANDIAYAQKVDRKLAQILAARGNPDCIARRLKHVEGKPLSALFEKHPFKNGKLKLLH